MTGRRFADLPDYAFPRLRALLDRHPAGGPVLSMSIGEPRHPVPEMLAETIARHAAGFAKYPPIDGTPGFRAAVANWIGRRYDLKPDVLDPDTQILPLNGTREGLFMAAVALAEPEKNGARAAVLLPNPFYQCYAAAALAAGAEPVYVPATAETGWLPDYSALPEALLERTTLAFYCSPSNPQGAVADAETLGRMAALAENYGFTIIFDECYSEIYTDTPPPGALKAMLDEGADPDHVLVFNSLSKRSNAPGLRSGFVAGGSKPMAALKRVRSYGGAPCSLPALHAAEALWRDEAHVVANRALYAEKFELTDRVLGGLPGYRRPDAGFFLWLDVGDGEEAALHLWREHGVRALPGGYLGRGDPLFLGGANPGAAFLRVALVEPAGAVERGLNAIADYMTERAGRVDSMQRTMKAGV